MAEQEPEVVASPEPEKKIHLTHEQADQLAKLVMGKQATLSVSVAVVFLIALLGLPLFNYYNPERAAMPVFGITLTWLILGLLFYPITWVLSFFFVHQSDKIEAECLKLVPTDVSTSPTEVTDGAI